MTNLESACEVIVENARANCAACKDDQSHMDGSFIHTCHATIAAAEKLGLAAARATREHTKWTNEKGRPIPCAGCSLCETEATIERLLGKGGDE